jgi:hypothetical protein
MLSVSHDYQSVSQAEGELYKMVQLQEQSECKTDVCNSKEIWITPGVTVRANR